MYQIHVQGLTKSYRIAERQPGMVGAVKSLFHRSYRDVEALRGIDFDISRGEMVGYIGPNGAGKSTTIKILAGILVPTSGRCEVNGLVPWQSRISYVAQIGVVFGQRTQLWWDLPVVESFDLLREIYKVPTDRFKSSLTELVELLDLGPLLDIPVRQLSLGQRVKCDIASALLHEPLILFLDEPTIGLDAVTKASVRGFIKEINRNRDVTVLLTTHDLGDIEALCRRVIVISDGVCLSDSSIDELRSQYVHEKHVVIQFGSAPCLDPIHKDDVLKSEGTRITFLCTTDISDFVAQMTSRYEIKDITIETPPIERVVTELYQSSR
ncbi:MAG: ABC transporter ATP-binding protein [Gammaproteobacteria bacterium]|nr:ABC transporter ATP-binding protein [Gammaproteobacteria bacterium]